MREPLQYVTYDSEHDHYVRVYECEHITDRTYPASELAGGVVHVGEHASIAVCTHCWQHVKGMVLEEVLKDAVRQRSLAEIRTDLLGKPRGVKEALRAHGAL